MELSREFQAKLRDLIIPEIRDLSAKYKTDVIEVIGHTDGVPIRQTASSMDQRLITFLNSSSEEAPPLAADNIGLGMGRAAAVIRALRENPNLRQMTLLPLSAGQTTDSDDRPIAEENLPANPDEQRRRIEIRLRRKFGN
jgi:flagellar motor protein MotB